MEKPLPLSRSEVMSRVRSADTRPEMRVRRMLHAMGHRFRLQARELPGRSDIVFRGDRIAIFVHGCFWHRHEGCPHTRTPKSRIEFWSAKFAANVRRDRAAEGGLKDVGWTVMTIWECETRDADRLASAVAQITALRAAAKAGQPASHGSSVASEHQRG